MNQLVGEPTDSQHSKWLREEKAVPPPKPVCKTAHKVACKCMPTHTTNCSMCLWCSDAPEHPQYPLGVIQAIKDNQHHPWHDAMDNNAATTRPLHLLHLGPGLHSDERTHLKGCASNSGDHQEAPSVFWTMLKPHMPCSHHKIAPTMMMMLAHPKTALPAHPSCTHTVTMPHGWPLCPTLITSPGPSAVMLPDLTAGPGMLYPLFLFSGGVGFHVTPPVLIYLRKQQVEW